MPLGMLDVVGLQWVRGQVGSADVGSYSSHSPLHGLTCQCVHLGNFMSLKGTPACYS